MSIEIKKSIKPVDYLDAIAFLEKRVAKVNDNRANELIWILEHPSTFTAGTSYNNKDIIDKSIKIINSSRGGKITWHGPGQLIFYFVINLNNRKKDIRNFLTIIEDSIITTLNEFGISSYSDRKNIGIWTKINNKERKIGSIGIKVKKWIAYHGFSININNNINAYKKIIPCGIKDKEVSNLKLIKDQNYDELNNKIINNFIKNLEI